MHETETPDNPPEPPAPKPPEAHPYAVFRNADFRRYISARFIAATGMQMLVVAIDWELYERTGSALALGFVGLALMIPMILCTLPAGHVADSFNRKTIILGSTLSLCAASLGLTLVSAFTGGKNILWFQILVYALLGIIGVARTFLWPASAAFVTSLVTREQLPRAITFNSGAFQLSCVIGPAIAGVLIWLLHGAWVVYAINLVAGLVCLLLIAGIRHEHKIPVREPVTFRSLVTGFRFVFENKIILGTLTLDMFAVLLGGAVSLLPIFAKDILNSGPDGLGLLRSAMPAGALVCTLIIAHRPTMEKAGRAMLWCVAIFGVATMLFGLVNQQCLGRSFPAPDAVWFWLAFGLLALCGAVDNVSVVIRATLVQVLTPDEKRGRVSAANSLFIGTSNELGSFESGFTAQLFGPMMANSIATGTILSTVVGGFGTIVVVAAVAWIWPQLRRYGKLA
ncbi:MAG: MFS transporter [Verrucomicrobiota bacterium]